MIQENKGRISEGTELIGNVNGAKMKVVKIENCNVIIEDASGCRHSCGLKALEHCDIKIL